MTRERGGTIVEAAFTLLVLFVLLMGAIGFGIVFHSYQSLTDAAREGARYAVIAPGVAVSSPSSARIAGKVCGYLVAGTAAPSSCPTPTGTALSQCVINGGAVPSVEDVYVSQCNVAQPNAITVTYTEVDIRKNIKLPILPAISLHTTAAMRNESN
jgi:Flp pilus assembly protein TadG